MTMTLDWDANLAHQVFEEKFLTFIEERYGRQDVSDDPALRLPAACSYALRGEGKRVRPVFCLLFAKAHGGRVEDAVPAACALELIHTYSLVHDDLPLLDDDGLRRGRPTTHIVFDPATALLAGDALLTDAFEVVCLPKDFPNARVSGVQRADMVACLAQAAGSRGMVDGQMRDVHWTGRSGAGRDDLDQVHLRKTGALIAAACQLGAIAAQASIEAQRAAWRFGELIGLTFQIIDDLMDASTGTGKSVGKDLEQGKLTYLTTQTMAEANARAHNLTQDAEQLLPGTMEFAPILAYAKSLLSRSR